MQRRFQPGVPVSWAWVGGLLAVLAIGVGGPAAWSWWARRALWDPARDPGAGRVGDAVRGALDALLAGPGTRGERVAAGLALCEVDEAVSWRGGLRRLVPLAEALGGDADGEALRAELALRLGQIDEARRRCGALPADHWRGCVVRAGLYALAGDEERADSALVAAGQLAPRAERDRLYRHLDARRRRRGVRVGPPLTLWERPPE